MTAKTVDRNLLYSKEFEYQFQVGNFSYTVEHPEKDGRICGGRSEDRQDARLHQPDSEKKGFQLFQKF